MAARARARRRWFMSDIPRTYLLLVWLAFGLVVFIYSNDWHPSGWSALRHEATVQPPQRPQTESYSGAIIIVPTRGDYCWQRMLDNRTGQMWDKGYVNCDEAVSRAEKEARSGMSTLRINAIGKAFNRSSDN
ncbi:MAG TPA: hypothetical protein VKG24_02300 [Pseudolabrys sp.]|jgi:hypothetical protein|nr:hypothetical protein [Pseudolabrys sp.]